MAASSGAAEAGVDLLDLTGSTDEYGGGKTCDAVELGKSFLGALGVADGGGGDQHGIFYVEALLEGADAGLAAGEVGTAFVGEGDDLDAFVAIFIIEAA